MASNAIFKVGILAHQRQSVIICIPVNISEFTTATECSFKTHFQFVHHFAFPAKHDGSVSAAGQRAAI